MLKLWPAYHQPQHHADSEQYDVAGNYVLAAEGVLALQYDAAPLRLILMIPKMQTLHQDHMTLEDETIPI